ncbi:MAG: bifunctional demethylmenaquinone methyltransferase/2-methoxy-6-polyprenyl-1,4-benzoquinol methylase UbiE [Kofleriaceae bacterium]
MSTAAPTPPPQEGALVPAPSTALGSGEMFDRIAGRYDFLNRVLSLGIDRSWRKRTVRALALGDEPRRVLDLATGTGDLAIAVARTHPRAEVIGIDPSAGMLDVGRRKVRARGLDGRVELRLGDAQALELAPDSFDAVTIAFGIRNVPDRLAGLREMARVARPGGKVAVLELGEPRRGLLARGVRFHTHRVVPWLGGLLSGQREYRYLQRSIAAFPDADTFAGMMTSAGLRVTNVRPMMFGVCTLFVAEKPGAAS